MNRVLRPADGDAALRQRLRPAPGPARRGGRDRDLRRAPARRRARRSSSATARRPATTRSSATSSPRTSPPPSTPARAGPTTSAPASSRPCSTSLDALRDAAGLPADGFQPEFQPARLGELERSLARRLPRPRRARLHRRHDARRGHARRAGAPALMRRAAPGRRR